MRAVVSCALVLCACPRSTPVVDAGVAAAPGRVDAGKPRPGALDELEDAGASLAWISEASGQPQVVVNGRALTKGTAAHYLQAATRAGIVVTMSEPPLEQLALIGLDGGRRLLGDPSSRARNAVVSPDGTWLVFESGARGLSVLERIELTDGGASALVYEPHGAFEPSIAPDGRWIAFVSSRDGDAELYRLTLADAKTQRLTAFHLEDLAPRISPDGKWIAFVSNREGQDRLFLVKPDGRGQRRLHREDAQDERWDAGSFEPGEAEATWSPDSKRVVFSARGPRGFWHLYAADVATGARTQLTDGAWDDQLPAVSADGALVAFVSTRTGNADVHVLLRDGGVVQVSNDPSADWKPVFIPR